MMPCEPLKHAVRILISDLFVPMSLKRQKLHFFSGLISTTKFNSVYFIAMRISYIHFFTAVHLYDFHISTIIIHHLDGLFGPNLMTSSQLACQLSWQSAAPVSQRSWVQIPYGPEFFSGLISTTSSVVFIAARISYIHFFTTVQIYDFHKSTIIINQTFLLRSLYSCNSSGSLIFCLGG